MSSGLAIYDTMQYVKSPVATICICMAASMAALLLAGVAVSLFFSAAITLLISIVAAAELSHRYITDRFLPDKAIDLMDEATSRIAMELQSVPSEIDEVQRRLVQLELAARQLAEETEPHAKERLAEIGRGGAHGVFELRREGQHFVIDFDFVERQIKMLGSKLCISGCMALAIRLRAGIDRHAAFGFRRGQNLRHDPIRIGGFGGVEAERDKGKRCGSELHSFLPILPQTNGVGRRLQASGPVRLKPL